ncbi:MAG: hypothetical protein V4532_07040 [Pseudomonadota bacterium]
MGTDWSGRKYRVLKALGEEVDMIFGVVQPSNAGVTWYLHSHEKDDGIGALVKILASFGVVIPPKVGMSHLPKPGFWGRLKALRLHLHNSRAVDYPWRRNAPSAESVVEPCFVYYLMPEADSVRVKQHSRGLDVGETSFFLACLDKVCRDRYLSQPSERVWMMPHDFRRSLGISRQSGNCTAPVSVRLSGQPSAKDIFVQVKGLYQQGILWGSWSYTNFARFLTDSMIKKAYARLKNRAWFGVYANMSAWQTPQGDTPKLAGAWLLSAPPVSAVCPITAGSITWEGRTGFTLQLHPSLNADRQAVMDLMALWLGEIYDAAGVEHVDITPQIISMQDMRRLARRLDA